MWILTFDTGPLYRADGFASQGAYADTPAVTVQSAELELSSMRVHVELHLFRDMLAQREYGQGTVVAAVEQALRWLLLSFLVEHRGLQDEQADNSCQRQQWREPQAI